MKLGLVIASHGRPDILQKVLMNLVSQPRIPDDIIVSAVDPADIPEIDPSIAKVRKVFGNAGLTCQRNRGMSYLIDTTDVIIFIDDDFVVGDDYFLNLERIFERDRSIIGVNGEVIADGANSAGLTFEEGLRLAEQHSQHKKKAAPVMQEITGAYGCNMAFRAVEIGSVQFDERLPLYGWQEDLDFCGALRGSGRIVKTDMVWGVHLGTKRGKGSEVRTRLFANHQSGLHFSQRQYVVRVRVPAGWTKLSCQPHQEHPPGKPCRPTRPAAGQHHRFVSLDDWSIDSRIYN